jgi:hypothetical protein
VLLKLHLQSIVKIEKRVETFKPDMQSFRPSTSCGLYFTTKHLPSYRQCISHNKCRILRFVKSDILKFNLVTKTITNQTKDEGIILALGFVTTFKIIHYFFASCQFIVLFKCNLNLYYPDNGFYLVIE